MAAHTCETCGLLHDMPVQQGESEAIALARIAAEQAVEVERIRAGAQRAEARAIVEAAHEEARGEADAAEAQAEVIGDAIEAAAEAGSEDPVMEVIAPEVTTDVDVEEPDDAPPPAEGSEPPAPEKSRGLGMW